MAEEFWGLSKTTVIEWFALYRDICTKWLAAISPIIGGVGHIVQVDESVGPNTIEGGVFAKVGFWRI